MSADRRDDRQLDRRRGGELTNQRGGVVRFRILGPLEFWDGQGWSGIGAGKWRALLAALLLHSSQVVSTESLIAELWGDQPPKGAANLVSVYVLRLRRLLGDAESQVLVTRYPGYQLLLGSDDLDAALFENLAQQGRDALASGDPPGAADLLARALAVWRGGALADVHASQLVGAEASRLEESRLSTTELRIAADLRCGLAAELVPELHRLLADHPLREGLWVLLMRALDSGGRRAEAIATYGEARQVISDELGVDPGPELRQVYQELLQADTAAQSDAPPATAAGLADAPRADAAGQASVTQADAPRGSAGGRRGYEQEAPAQLPADLADFTGRQRHLRQLRSMLAAGSDAGNPTAVNVVGVVGTPGLGKTALAVHAAHELRREFPDGQLFVSLLGGGQQPAKPHEVLARLLRDLGLAPGRIPASLEERAALYRTRLADRRVLIVLDDARDAAQVRPLLPGSASCAVIVTSRHWLSDLAGGRLVDLELLDDDEAQQMLTRIVGEHRVAEEPGPVREILAACAGLPLAIRIAGARLAARRGWTIGTLARRLADQHRRLDELTTGDLAVRACFEVSFSSLPQPQAPGSVDPARAFRLLGLWHGSHISLQAAAALLGEPVDAAADALEMLVDTHLLESPQPEWYRFHDLLRAYAAERATAEEASEVCRDSIGRLLHWYLRTADAAVSRINPNRPRVPLDPAQPSPVLEFDTADDAMEWSKHERANLVAATRQAAAQGLADVAWKLPVTIMLCFDLHGYREEWLVTHEVALTSARAIGDRGGEAWVLNNIGMVLSQQRAPDTERYFEQALAIHRELGDLRGMAQATNNLAYSYQYRGLHERAVVPLQDALALQREVGHRYGESVALCNLGEVYLELGRYEQAISCEQDALVIIREIGLPRLEGYILRHLGRAYHDSGSTQDGTALLEQALALHRAEGDKYGEALDLQYLGESRIRAGRKTEARGMLERAAELLESLGDTTPAAVIRSALNDLDAPAARLGAVSAGPAQESAPALSPVAGPTKST